MILDRVSGGHYFQESSGAVIEKLIINIASLLNQIINIEFIIYGVPIRLLYIFGFIIVFGALIAIIRSVG